MKSGERSFIHSGSGGKAKDGWLYYADSQFCEDSGWVEIMRRNLEDGTIKSCGTVYLPYLGAQTFRKTIEFGEKGFIIFSTYDKKDADYTYFPYGASQGQKLHIAPGS